MSDNSADEIEVICIFNSVTSPDGDAVITYGNPNDHSKLVVSVLTGSPNDHSSVIYTYEITGLISQ